MDAEIFIDGVKYISSSRAVEKTGYNQDYIGQLCREKKVRATFVGRTWFVCKVDILRHLKEKQIKKGQLERVVVEKQITPIKTVKNFTVRKIDFQILFWKELDQRMAFLTMLVLTLFVVANSFLFWSVAPEGVFWVAHAVETEIKHHIVKTEMIVQDVVESTSVPVLATQALLRQALELTSNIFNQPVVVMTHSFTVAAHTGQTMFVRTSERTSPFFISVVNDIHTIASISVKTSQAVLDTLSLIPSTLLTITENSLRISSTNISYLNANAVFVVGHGVRDLVYKSYSGAWFAFSHIDQATRINFVIGQRIYNSLSELPFVFSKTFRQSLFVGDFILKTTADGLSDLTMRTAQPLKKNGLAFMQTTVGIFRTSVASVKFGVNRYSQLQENLQKGAFKFVGDTALGGELILGQVTEGSFNVTAFLMNKLENIADYSYDQALRATYVSKRVAITSYHSAERILYDGRDAVFGATNSSANVASSAQTVMKGALGVESVVSDGLVFIFTWTSQNLLAGWDTLHLSFFGLLKQTKHLVYSFFPTRDASTPVGMPIDFPNEGFVVLPGDSKASVGETIRHIQNSFSDEVHVVESTDGASGVITPIFKSGQGQEYIYVIVPIKKDEKGN